ncbi:MAG TPA: magnesium transporter, partial [bacterium]|nr:magnesium transporter [bacterium]
MPTASAQKAPTRFGIQDLEEIWSFLSAFERLEGLRALPKNEANDFFRSLNARDQADLILALPPDRRQVWLQVLAPDDLADMIQEVTPETRGVLLSQFDDLTRKEVNALLAYAEDVAGGLMNPRFIRLRPDMTVEEAFSYLRKQAQEREHFYDAYVLDNDQHLLGVMSFKELFTAPYNSIIRDIMRTDLVKAQEDLDQESVSRLFKQHNLVAIPVVDADNKMKGIVTLDDIVDVVQEEATEDIQKMGATESLNAPYLKVSLFEMVRKRAGWLSALFLGEMLTATAMAFFEHEIAKAVVLALFIPLIISSGGNSGSQATTLIISAMAVGDVKLRDWFKVVRRELASGIFLGLILGTIGFLRIMLWPSRGRIYGEHYMLIAMTVAFSLIGVVLFGTIAGSMLPFLLRRLGFDPASASAPFVATLVDVTGLVIYFSVAQAVLTG